MFRSARILLFISVLVLASLACQAVMGGDASAPVAEPQIEQSEPQVEQPDDEADQPVAPEPTDALDEFEGGLGFETEFPLPEDASNGFDFGDGMISFQTELSIEESLAFYRESFTDAGYTEREILTSVTDTVFSVVFDGHESGKAIVIQAVDLGNGSVNITIRFEDV